MIIEPFRNIEQIPGAPHPFLGKIVVSTNDAAENNCLAAFVEHGPSANSTDRVAVMRHITMREIAFIVSAATEKELEDCLESMTNQLQDAVKLVTTRS